MIQVNCHLSSSRFQPCLHAAFKRPGQNIKSRRERYAIFVCLFYFLSLTGKLEPSLRAPNKTVSSHLKTPTRIVSKTVITLYMVKVRNGLQKIEIF